VWNANDTKMEVGMAQSDISCHFQLGHTFDGISYGQQQQRIIGGGG
jgi:hypothetical protein